MVFNPYDNEDSSDDPKKAKLRNQAQQEYIAQLQQRIANQSNKIEELLTEISRLNDIISSKDHELANYSLKVQEEREFFEQDKKARNDREYELTKQLQQKEAELKQTRDQISTPSPLKPTQPPEEPVPLLEEKATQLDNYVDTLMAYYKNPTKESFVNALRDMMVFCSTKGTVDQQILGFLLKAEKPLTEDELKQRINVEPQQVTRALFRLEQKNHIKKVGRGFTVVSSEFAEMTDISTNWGSLTVERVYENLLSVVYVESDSNELIKSFTKARDALMEMGELSASRRHELSQILEKLKNNRITSEELTNKILEWKVQ